MPRTFYRIVQTDPPHPVDFTSNKAKGLPPRGPELTDPDLHDDVSVWDTRAAAEYMARRYPKIGAFIAELQIPDDAPVRIRQTGQPGHYSLWGDPAALLSFVARVTPV